MAKAGQFLGRFLFALIFLGAGVDKILNFNKETGGPLMAELAPKLDNFFYKLRSQGFDVPSPQQYYPQVLLAAAVFEFMGGLLFALDYKFGAYLLMIFLASATLVMHNFWDVALNTAEYQLQMIHALKNLSLFGALLYYVNTSSGGGMEKKPKRD